MENTPEMTKNKIIEVSRELFATLGFNNVSMRRIAKDASLTTGALYNHFENKDDLFECIVGKSAKGLLELFSEVHQLEDVDLLEKYGEMEDEVAKKTIKVIDYLYDNFGDMKIIFTKASGSKYENFIDDLVEIEDVLSRRLYKNDELGYVDEFFIHVLATMGVRNFLEVIYHDLSKEEALDYMNKIQHFYRYGYMGIVDKMTKK